MTRAEQEVYWIKYPHTIPLILRRYQGGIQYGAAPGSAPFVHALLRTERAYNSLVILGIPEPKEQ